MSRSLFIAAVLSLSPIALAKTSSQLEKDLREKHFHQVAFSITRTEIDAAVKSYQRFLKMSPEEKSYISFKVHADRRRSDAGYIARSSSDRRYDDKEYFHYHPAIFEQHTDFIDKHLRVSAFLNHADRLWKASVDTVGQVLDQLESRYPGIKKMHLEETRPEIYVRFLQYRPRSSSEQLARAHYDAGTLTLAIAESGPGLRIADRSGRMVPVIHKPGSALFFLGGAFPNIDSDGFFQPAWHDVVRVSSSDAPAERWAVVCFFNAPTVPQPSWEANHQAAG